MTVPATRTPSRRTLVRGAALTTALAWQTPVITHAATAPAFTASNCGVTGGITVGPLTTTDYRAICASQSQNLTPTTIKTVYGTGLLPQYLDICTCDQIAGWYRWRETDTLSDFQIEVDGRHSDQNGPEQGYRPAFYLSLDDACRRFNLTYRTSADRSRSTRTNFSITWVLERSTGGQAGPWQQVQTITRQVSLVRTTGTNSNDGVNFNQCSAQRVTAGAWD